MKNTCYNSVLRTLLALCIAGWFGGSVAQACHPKPKPNCPPHTAIAAIVIDPYTNDQFVKVSGPPEEPRGAKDTLTSSSVFGGKRELMVYRTSANGASVSLDVGYSRKGVISYSSSGGATGYGQITYGDVNSLPVDLTQGGKNDRFLIGLSSDLGSTLTMTIITDSIGSSSVSVPVPVDPEHKFNMVEVPFASFSGTGSFKQVRAITLFIDGSIEAVDVGINVFIVTNPPGPNCPPDAIDDCAKTCKNVPVVINVLKNDKDLNGDPLTVTSVTQPANGAVVINPDNTVTYTPKQNFSGTDTFYYTISDGYGGTDTAKVRVYVMKCCKCDGRDYHCALHHDGKLCSRHCHH